MNIDCISNLLLEGISYRFPRRLYHLTFGIDLLTQPYDMTRAGERGGTLYGQALNVTTEPEAWIKIAKLGGATILRVNLSAGAKLLNYHDSFSGGPEAQPEFMSWMQQMHPILVTDAYRVPVYDEEGNEGYMDLASQADAELERREDTDTIQIIKSVKNNRKWELFYSFLRSQFDPSIIGIWFDDDLEPANYSAPHGIIFDTTKVTFKKVK